MPDYDIHHLVHRKLGKRFAERFEQLKGIPLENSIGPKTESLNSFRKFLESIGELERANPSLFLTDEGNLEMVWEDSEGKSVQFEFQNEAIEHYREATNFEQITSIEKLESLLFRSELAQKS